VLHLRYLHEKQTHHILIHCQSYLIDLIKTNKDGKNGEAMCEAFEKMIDKAENEYGVIVVCFCCDNDGGSQNGRKRLIEKRPWLFGPPCCGHQVRFKFSLTDGFKSY
jgi:hypothetical protein